MLVMSPVDVLRKYNNHTDLTLLPTATTNY